MSAATRWVGTHGTMRCPRCNGATVSQHATLKPAQYVCELCGLSFWNAGKACETCGSKHAAVGGPQRLTVCAPCTYGPPKGKGARR